MQIHILCSKSSRFAWCTTTIENRKHRASSKSGKSCENSRNAEPRGSSSLLGAPRLLSPPPASYFIKARAEMKARSLLVSAVATCALSSGPSAVSAAAVAASSAANHGESSTTAAAAVPEVAGNAEATRRVLAQTKEERVSLSAVAGPVDRFTLLI